MPSRMASTSPPAARGIAALTSWVELDPTERAGRWIQPIDDARRDIDEEQRAGPLVPAGSLTDVRADLGDSPDLYVRQIHLVPPPSPRSCPMSCHRQQGTWLR